MSRYLPAESAALFAAVAGALVGWNLTARFEAAALASNWAEAGAFYLVMAMREFAALQTGRGRLATVRLVLRNLTMEFALAELLDSLIIRPIFMDLGMRAMGLAVGIIVGKVSADVTFYVPTIISYELRLRRDLGGAASQVFDVGALGRVAMRWCSSLVQVASPSCLEALGGGTHAVSGHHGRGQLGRAFRRPLAAQRCRSYKWMKEARR
jgi:hypothetical protein